MPQRRRNTDSQPTRSGPWYRKAGGLLYWIALAIWIGCILYPWIIRLIHD